MQFPPNYLTTAASSNGVFFGSQVGMDFVSGPPIELYRFDLLKDNPSWDCVDPRLVDWRPRRSRRQMIRIRRREGRACWYNRTLRDLKHLRRMIGSGLFRSASRLPLTARPFSMVWMSHRDPAFRDLLLKTPMIAVALAHYMPSEAPVMDLDDWRKACSEESLMRRRQILENRSLPSTSVGGFQRITESGADPLYLSGLSETLRDRHILKWFNHAKAIGPDLIRILANRRFLSHVTGRFLRLVGDIDSRQQHARFAPMLEFVISLLKLGEARGAKNKVFNTPQKLQECYYRIAGYVLPGDVEQLRPCQFKPSGIRGIPGFVEPILTGEDLITQAVCMQQCCSARDYVKDLLAGHIFLFRASGYGIPPCTIEITDSRCYTEENVGYVLTQIAGFRNSTLPMKALSAIRVWAEDEGIKMPYRHQDVHQNPDGQSMIRQEEKYGVLFETAACEFVMNGAMISTKRL